MNEQAKFATEGTFTPLDLVISGPVHTDTVVYPTGQTIVAGTLLGKQTIGAATPVKTGTGNGTCTMDATTPILANAQVGAYKALCTAAGTNTATFEIFDPLGNSLGEVALAGTFANQIKFVIADGSTDFIVGDYFTITVAAGTGKYIPSLAAAVDGSQVPVAIAAEDITTTGDYTSLAYIGGTFNSSYMTFGTGHTAASTKAGLRKLGIYLDAANAVN